MRIILLFVVFIAALGTLRAEERPNILFFFSDDQRYDTLGVAGHPIVQTPALDQLARDGVRFENAFVTTAICWVSRATILTGQWARSHAVRDSMPVVKEASMNAGFSPLLRAAGYRTGYFGKWHTLTTAGFEPASLFDAFEVIGRNPYFKTLPDGSKRHETDLIADRGIEFIKAQPKGQPFHLNLWFNAAHAEDNDRRPGAGHYPWPPSADGLYEDVTIPLPRHADEHSLARHPDFLMKSINRERFFWGYDTPEKYETNVRAYYRMITGIDRAIARVLAALEEAGLAGNTIVVFMSDNGYYLGDRGFQGKWSHFEESIRVPLIIRDPRQPAALRGRVVSPLALNVDLPSTFLDWAGVSPPKHYEGRSLAPVIGGATPADWRHHFFVEHVDLAPSLTWEGIRSSHFTYARYFDQSPVYEFLHDLTTDPDQLTNLVGDPAYAATLAAHRALTEAEIASRGGPLLPLPDRHANRTIRGRMAPPPTPIAR